MKTKSKVIVILGPTGSGKTKLAVKLARKFNGEIISADSRQVYRGMDIGTGKDLKEYGKIPHHLIDVASPKGQFSLARYQQLAYKAIDDVLRRGRLPILCGGTGLYISALVDGYVLSDAKPDKKLRAKLAKKTLPQLLKELRKIDLQTFEVIDQKNRRRVERAIEIYNQTGLTKSAQLKKQKPAYKFLLLGLTFPKDILNQRIEKRLKVRLEKEGMVDEVKRLYRQGVSWKRLDDFGLEYRWVSRYLQNQIDYQTMVLELQKAICNFSKRQMTWFKRNSKIVWLNNQKQAERLAKNFIG